MRFDSIRCRKISADSIPIRFAYLIAYFVRRNDDDDGGHGLENIDAETLPRQVPREKEERARKKEDCGEVPRKTRPQRAV